MLVLIFIFYGDLGNHLSREIKSRSSSQSNYLTRMFKDLKGSINKGFKNIALTLKFIPLQKCGEQLNNCFNLETVKLRNPNVGAGGGVFTGRVLNGAAPRRKVTTTAPKGRSMAGRAPLASLSVALQREGGRKATVEVWQVSSCKDVLDFWIFLVCFFLFFFLEGFY